MKRERLTILLGLCLSVGAACATARPELPVETAAERPTESYETYMARGFEEVKQAWQLDHMRAAIADFEKADVVRPNQKEALFQLSRLYYAMTYCFYKEITDENERMELYNKGKKAGYRAMLLVPEFKQAMDEGKAIDEETIKLIPKEFAGVMFLMTANWSRWGELKGVLTQAFDIPKVKAMLDRAVELDEGFYYGGPHRALGGYYSLLPGMFGGDAEKSGEHFRRAIELDPDYLENHYMYVFYYALHGSVENEKLFDTEIQFILNHPIEPDHPDRAAQEAAVRMAKDLLDKKADLF